MRLAFIVATVLLVSSATFAQAPAPGGTLVVTIVDSTGAVLPGATVSVKGVRSVCRAISVPSSRHQR